MPTPEWLAELCVIGFTIARWRIVETHILADPEHCRKLVDDGR